MSEEWAWSADDPVFTLAGRRRHVRVPRGAERAPITGRYVAIVLGFAVGCGAALAAIGLIVARVGEGQADGWWWLALAVPAALCALMCVSGLYVEGVERIMRPSAVALIGWAAFAAGITLGSGILALTDILREREPYAVQASGADVLLGAAVLAALAAGVLGVLGVRSAREARREAARILRLRSTVQPEHGSVVRLPDPKTWNGGGDVPVRYSSGAETRTIEVRVTTRTTRIPVPGTAVLVYTDADGSRLVELDPAHPVEHSPHSRRYETDSSGGGY